MVIDQDNRYLLHAMTIMYSPVAHNIEYTQRADFVICIG